MAARGSNISSTHSFLPTDDEIAIMRLLNSPDGYVCCAQVCIVPAFSERAMIAAVHGSTLTARPSTVFPSSFSRYTDGIGTKKIASVEHHRSYAQAV